MYFFRIRDRRTSLTAQEILDLGPITTENTIVDVDVICEGSGHLAEVIATVQVAYNRASTNKRQLAALVRAKAVTAIDISLFGTGGEGTLVGVRFPV
jgi:thiamine biosynthesis protein ThiC